MTILYVATIIDSESEQCISTNLDWLISEITKRVAYIDLFDADDAEIGEHKERWDRLKLGDSLPNPGVLIQQVKPKEWFGDIINRGVTVFEGDFCEFIDEYFCHRCWTPPDDDYYEIRTDIRCFKARKLGDTDTCADCEPLIKGDDD